MHASVLHPLGLANPTVCILFIPADLVSGKEVPGARLDYHDEIVRDCSWHPTQNTIVTTSFDGSVVQCVLQLHTPNSWSSSVVSGQCLMSARVAANRECTATAFGDASPCLFVVGIVKRPSSTRTTATSATACPAGGTRSRLSTRTQLRSAAGAAGEQPKSLQSLSMPVLCSIVQAGCFKRCDA